MTRWRDVKVGLFILIGIVMAVLVIFLIGSERRLFETSTEFHARFSDVQGLKPGAPIRMGGIDIGHVDSVGYGSNPTDSTIYVKLVIVRSEAGRIRKDSVVSIASRGLLGDKMLEVSKGQSDESVPPSGEIVAEQPADMMGKVNLMAAKAEGALTQIEATATNLSDENLHKDLRGSVAGLHVLLDQLSAGDGYPHKLLTDKEEAERITRTIQNLDRATSELNATLASVRGVVQRVEHGPGFAHDLIYAEAPPKPLLQIGDAATEVATTLRTMREADSVVHDAVFGGKGPAVEAMQNVAAITGDVRAMVADAKQGKGTLGALLVDPSIYQDLKSILGNVERNDVLRALVRFTIKQDEKRTSVSDSAPKR